MVGTLTIEDLRNGNGLKMNRVAHFLCLALVLFAVAIPAHADEVDDYIQDRMNRQHIPGLAVAVLRAGKPLKVKGYGTANLELGTPVTPETVFKIGSVSKQFIAAGIVLLNKEGKVGYEDSIRKYFPDAPASWQPITVRHLLTHTSGLVRESPAWDPLEAQRDADLVKATYATPLVFQPGENWQYCNIGYFALAEIITRVSGKPWPDYLREKIFVPLGMSATRTTTNEVLIPNRASSYEWSDGKYSNAEFMLAVRPSGAFISTVLDLARWDAALYTDAPFTAKERELMWTKVKLNNGTERDYGFGWQIDQVGMYRQIRHGGTLTGFRSDFSRFIHEQLTVIVLANSSPSVPETIAVRVAAFYIPDLLPKRTPVKVDAKLLDTYTGRYQTSGGRERIITRRGDALTIAVVLERNQSLAVGVLRPESPTRFYNEDDPRPTWIFATDDKGRRQLVQENPDGREAQTFTRSDP